MFMSAKSKTYSRKEVIKYFSRGKAKLMSSNCQLNS